MEVRKSSSLSFCCKASVGTTIDSFQHGQWLIHLNEGRRTHCSEWNAVALAGRVHRLSDLVGIWFWSCMAESLQEARMGKGYPQMRLPCQVTALDPELKQL